MTTIEAVSSPPVQSIPTESVPQPQFLPHWDSRETQCSKVPQRRRAKPPSTLRSWIVEHQTGKSVKWLMTGLSINLLLLLFFSHLAFPQLREHTRPFFKLSYADTSNGLYKRGPQDLFYVIFLVVVFTGLRAYAMDQILLPFAAWTGLSKRKTRIRFAEQAWMTIYYSVFWTFGMVRGHILIQHIMYNSKYWFNLAELWTDFPIISMNASSKFYYLAQFAFWIQQIIVVNIEERRKDHWQMFSHHIVTCLLCFTSYGYYQQRAGNVVLCLMDVVDLIFPVAKMLKYTGHQTLCDTFFGLFILTWAVTRHFFYFLVIKSIIYDAPVKMTYGCYSSVDGSYLDADGGTAVLSNFMQPYLRPWEPICYNSRMKYVFLGLLSTLQGLLLMWMVMILRVAWRVIKGNGADDSRSDDEEVEESEDSVRLFPIEIEQPVEEYVNVDGLQLKRRASPRFGARTKKNGSSTALAFGSSSDRKELLGRIGCDKPS